MCILARFFKHLGKIFDEHPLGKGIILKAINCSQQAEPLGQLSLHSDAGRSTKCLLLLAFI